MRLFLCLILSKNTAKKPGMTIVQKVLHALELLETGKTKDVANKMIEVFPEYQKKPEKAIADARYHISDLKQAATIEVVEEGVGSAGKTYRYIKK